jgi:hypothetical protein
LSSQFLPGLRATLQPFLQTAQVTRAISLARAVAALPRAHPPWTPNRSPYGLHRGQQRLRPPLPAYSTDSGQPGRAIAGHNRGATAGQSRGNQIECLVDVGARLDNVVSAVAVGQAGPHIIEQKACALVVHRIEPQHSLEDTLGFLEPIEPPEAQAIPVHAPQEGPVADQAPGQQAVEVRG